MGVNHIMKIIKSTDANVIQSITIKSLKDKKIAIDMSLLLYKIYYGMGKSNVLSGLQLKLENFKKNKITCVCVFDGCPDGLKDECIQKRIESKKEDDFTITDALITDIMNLLKEMNIEYICGEEEADVKLAELQMSGYVDYVYSDDTDIMFYGCNAILRNHKNNKIELLDASIFREKHKYSQEDFVKLAVLLGNDYNKNPPNVGPVKAVQCVSEKMSFEDIFTKYKIHDDSLMERMKKVMVHYMKLL